MMSFQVTLIKVPQREWVSLPQQRPFSELVKDAKGIERRILKGINAGRERVRYTQVCNWIEQSALTMVGEGLLPETMACRDTDEAPHTVQDYCDLLSCLADYSTSLSWRVAKSFFEPGEEVAQQAKVLAAIGEEEVMDAIGHISAQDAKNCAALARGKARFFRGDGSQGFGFVEVLSVLPTGHW